MAFNGTIHVNQPLTEVSVSFMQELDSFVADKACPVVKVKKESDLYYVYGREHFVNSPGGLDRANGAVAKEVDLSYSTSSYQLMEISGRMLVTDRDKANADQALQLEIDATKMLTEKVLIEKEVDLAGLLVTATFTNALSAATAQQWSLNTVTSDPAILYNTASAVVWVQSGKKINSSLIGFRSLNFLKVHTSVLDRVKYTERGIVSEELLASLFDLDNLFVSRGARQTRLENKNNTISASAAAADTVALAYWLPKSPGLRQPAAWYTFANGGPVVKSYRDEERNGTWVEISQLCQQRIVASQAAFLMTGVIA